MPHFMVHLIPSHEATNDYQPPVVTIGINDRLTIATTNVQGLHQIATITKRAINDLLSSEHL